MESQYKKWRCCIQSSYQLVDERGVSVKAQTILDELERIQKDRDVLYKTLSRFTDTVQNKLNEWIKEGNLRECKPVPICVKCDFDIIDECGVFDGPDGPLCRGYHEERFESGVHCPDCKKPYHEPLPVTRRDSSHDCREEIG